MSRQSAHSGRIKRFYKDVSCEPNTQGYTLLLDGRRGKTRTGNPLAAPTAALGEAVVAEWAAQQEFIDPAAMPLTKMLMTAIDLGARDRSKWFDIILAHFSSDLLCYRATEPAALVERQQLAWDPLLDWAANDLGINLITTIGLSHVDQPDAAICAARDMMDAISDPELLAVKIAAEVSGSGVIAFALWRNTQAPDALFAASRIDEDFQAERWGADAVAAARAEEIADEFAAAGRFLRLLASGRAGD